MDAPFLTTSLAVLTTLSLLALPLSATTHDILPLKSSLIVEEYETNILQSSDGTFSCGFYNIYTNAFTFSIWYSNSIDKAIVWSANRGRPVHSRRSAITLRKDGNIVLTDYDGSIVWQTDGKFPNVHHVQLLNTGNLVLKNSSDNIVWQSFDSPTDTFLPSQLISATTKLVSTTKLQAPGHYSFRFSDQSILSLIYDDNNDSSIYWPDPDYQYYENNRNLYNSTRIGSLNDSGEFFASDLANHKALVASDRSFGIKRRLTLDYDGNLRLYSLNNSDGTWRVSWIAQPQTCMTHGLCGPYGICHYSPTPICSCPPGYKMKNPGNWTQGCEPIIEITCDRTQSVTFLPLRNTDFWGSDQQRIEKVSLEVCRNTCISDCTCKGFQYQEGNGTCYPKSFLFNGRTFPTPFVRTMYIKLPSSLDVSKIPIPQSTIHDSTANRLHCDNVSTITTEGSPNMNKISGEESKWFYFYGFIGVFFVIEVFFFAFAWFFVLRKEMRSSQVWAAEEGYRVMTSHFRMYSYRELVKATERFKHELGWGGSGIAYKGILNDDRAVVIKKLENVTQNREEFHGELHVIAMINHMNLVRIYGFCSERFHRLLVLEYAENGSLANILFNGRILLDWKQRFNIALGVAKGLAYLHHECLEWVIHCNLKPENILLDKNLEPKITDFGLAKLLSRSASNQNVSRARGTIGYIAPEWISGLPITAKVDVYSYGVILLELVSGRRVFDLIISEDEKVHVMVKKFIKLISYRLDNEESLWLAEFVDFRLGDEFNCLQAKTLLKLAVSCLEEDRKRRPTMESIVESLLSVDSARTLSVESSIQLYSMASHLPTVVLIAFLPMFVPLLGASDLLLLGSSLTVEKQTDVLHSSGGTFACGFYNISPDVFTFSIWFFNSADKTVVWTANRFHPVYGWGSKVTLQKDGDMVLKNFNGDIVWKANGSSGDRVVDHAQLLNTGNLILKDQTGNILWQSFDSPTDTLLPTQPITSNTMLLKDLLARSSISIWDKQRKLFNSTRVGVLNELGQFLGSDGLNFTASDMGPGIKRRLTLDYDGNVRLYSLSELDGQWSVSYMAFSHLYFVDGLCGINGILIYSLARPICLCPPGNNMIDPNDWSKGCDLAFNVTCGHSEKVNFVKLPFVDFAGPDMSITWNISLDKCIDMCSNDCSCKAIRYVAGSGKIFPWEFSSLYLKLLENVDVESYPFPYSGFLYLHYTHSCNATRTKVVNALYDMNVGGEGKSFIYFYGFLSAFFAIEVFFIAFGCFILRRESKISQVWPLEEGYKMIRNHFRRYIYEEIKIATKSSNHLKMSLGITYRGILNDDRVIVVKTLESMIQGEEVLQAELTVIGRIYHMNLRSTTLLHWNQRVNIIIGIARGLAYLHHECLEWVIHCDVRPEKILLDHNWEPKIVDFGLAKLLSRCGCDKNTSQVRGTRGYMAPGWVSNLPITTKADVYIYGVVLLELVKGVRISNWFIDAKEYSEPTPTDVVKILTKKLEGSREIQVDEFVDSRLHGDFNYAQAISILNVIHCDIRPEKILLDHNWEPKIADFGLAKLLSRCGCDKNTSQVRGTRGYMAP
uniref:non-specific serine/threonine protein kinase n=1 Tax=Leersia perrieri TaxID=77586 RepID=A0A0D9XNS0_9ORYZ